jgi:hypothetical protein
VAAARKSAPVEKSASSAQNTRWWNLSVDNSPNRVTHEGHEDLALFRP